MALSANIKGSTVEIAKSEVAEASRSGRRPSTSHDALEVVAFRLFGERGFDETSIDDIAAAAGIGRRTFFRYYPTKADVVWGQFGTQLDGMRAWLAAVPDDLPLMEAVHQSVIEFNRLAPDQVELHRRRLGLILGNPTLLANSILRFRQWRQVVAEFAALRLGLSEDDLLPKVIGYSALGAAMAAYEQWLQDPDADLERLLDESLGELADGFSRH
jgi:mycofactocin system transcriptional regulator